MSLDNIDALSLLDATLDDLADLKKFEPLPVGAYRQQIAWTFPESDEYVEVRMDLKTLEVLEIPNMEPENFPEVGKVATFYFRLQRKDGKPMIFEKSGEVNDIDQGRLKEVLIALTPVFNPDGTLTNRELIQASEGAEVLTSLGQRPDKNDKDKKYQTIKSITMPE